MTHQNKKSLPDHYSDKPVTVETHSMNNYSPIIHEPPKDCNTSPKTGEAQQDSQDQKTDCIFKLLDRLRKSEEQHRQYGREGKTPEDMRYISTSSTAREIKKCAARMYRKYRKMARVPHNLEVREMIVLFHTMEVKSYIQGMQEREKTIGLIKNLSDEQCDRLIDKIRSDNEDSHIPVKNMQESEVSA